MTAAYLDNNATTAIDARVTERIQQGWTSGPSNPSSQHRQGRAARQALSDALEAAGRCLGARVGAVGGDRWIVTSGGSESNALALHGLLAGRSGPLVTSRIEHPSILEPAKRMEEQGREVVWLPAHASGVVDLGPLRARLASLSEHPKPALVSLMWANNETGVVQPVEEAVSLCRAFDIPVHVDASQAIGKIVVDFQRLGAAAWTISPHKFHGPVGIGGLLVSGGWNLEPLWEGGGQQLGTRPGTEPVALVLGMQRAIELATTELNAASDHMLRLREALERELRRQVPECLVHGYSGMRLPNTTLVSFPGIDRQALMMRLDLEGVACSTGSACSSGSSRPSHVLQAMGVAERFLESAVRLSLSKFSTMEEIQFSVDRIVNSVNKLRRNSTVENVSI